MRKVFNSFIFILVTVIAVWVFFTRQGMTECNIEIVEPESFELDDIANPDKKTVEIEKLETDIPDKSKVEKTVAAPVKVRIQKEQTAVAETVEVTVPVKKTEKIIPAADTAIVQVKEKEKDARDPPVAPTGKVESSAKIVKVEPPAKNIAEKNVPVKKVPEKKNTEKKVKYICSWLEEFEPDGHKNGVKFVDNWQQEGGILFTPKTRFYLKNDKLARDGKLLVIESKKSSAVFACDLSGKVDLNKTPILRWRWRVKKLPPFADGRHRKKDDQAVGVYIGAGNAFDQKALAYRWETETPLGHWGKINYSKMMKVWFLCLRNQDSGLNVWYEECRNVKEDFIAKYGFVPSKIALVICGNSQNSKSDALAEIDFIGFYSEIKD